MSNFFVTTGGVLLIFCFIWAYVWLEVGRDPKRELRDFYLRYPWTEKWVFFVNRLWLPSLALGTIFVVIGLFRGEG